MDAVKRASASWTPRQSTKRTSKKGKNADAKSATEEGDKAKRTGTKLIQEESSETGQVKIFPWSLKEVEILGALRLQVKWTVYKDYMAACGYWTCIGILLLYAISQAFVVASSIWLSAWSDDSLHNATAESPDLRVGVYAILGVAQCK